MFLPRCSATLQIAPFLCLRRGVSCSQAAVHPRKDFSLPTQRCFSKVLGTGLPVRLFSAYAEVFPTTGEQLLPGEGFSLPTQRCFLPCPLPGGGQALFSAYAEVFLRTFRITGLPDAFLCLRRGVSSMPALPRRSGSFSLPTQRCFSRCSSSRRAEKLFSAYAEVFLPGS